MIKNTLLLLTILTLSIALLACSNQVPLAELEAPAKRIILPTPTPFTEEMQQAQEAAQKASQARQQIVKDCIKSTYEEWDIDYAEEEVQGSSLFKDPDFSHYLPTDYRILEALRAYRYSSWDHDPGLGGIPRPTPDASEFPEGIPELHAELQACYK